MVDVPSCVAVQQLPLSNVLQVAWDAGQHRLFAGTRAGLYVVPCEIDGSHLLGRPELVVALDPGVHPNVVISRNGKVLAAAAGPQQLFVMALDSETSREITTDLGSRSHLAISPDGLWIAKHAEGKTQVIAALDGHRVTSLDTPGGYVAMSFSPDAKLLVVGSERTFAVWRTQDWQLLYRKPRSGTALWGVAAFSPDAKLIAIALDRFTVGLIHARSGNEICKFEMPEPRPDVHDLAFAENGMKLIIAGGNHQVLLWDLSRVRRHLSELQLNW